MSIVQAAVM